MSRIVALPTTICTPRAGRCPGVEVPQLAIERPADGVAELAARVGLVVADAVDDVASAEALRILECDDLERPAVEQVDQLEHDGRRAEIDCDTVDAAAPGLDRCVSVADHAIRDLDDGIDRPGVELRLGRDDPKPATQHRERDSARVRHHGLHARR